MTQRMFGCACIALLLGATAVACRTGGGNGRTGLDSSVRTGGGVGATGLTLASPDFGDGAPIPKRHAYRPEGENEPPTLAWSKVPAGAKELALIVEDPDAPRPEPWVHDVLYAIPPGATPMSAATRQSPDSVAAFQPGKNSWGEQGWGGPLPPPGRPHRYVFTLYALDAELDLAPGQTKEQVLGAMKGHVLDKATIIGTYQR